MDGRSVCQPHVSRYHHICILFDLCMCGIHYLSLPVMMLHIFSFWDSCTFATWFLCLLPSSGWDLPEACFRVVCLSVCMHVDGSILQPACCLLCSCLLFSWVLMMCKHIPLSGVVGEWYQTWAAPGCVKTKLTVCWWWWQPSQWLLLGIVQL